MSTFVMAGGGSGGHVIPALAVARELRARGHSDCNSSERAAAASKPGWSRRKVFPSNGSRSAV